MPCHETFGMEFGNAMGEHFHQQPEEAPGMSFLLKMAALRHSLSHLTT